MTAEDFEQLQRVARQLPAFSKVGVFSPWREYEGTLFPKAKALPRWRWNLNEPMPWPRRFDLLVACNVFMYSPDPERWFRHVFAVCKYFLMIDPIRRRRSHASEITDDAMRYSIGDERPRGEPSFDLESLGDRLLGYHTYFGGANLADDDPRHVIAIFRGDLADPMLRIDDYPTGIRPILSDLSPLHGILQQIEAHGLAYYLGIVPKLLTDEMVDFLNSLEHMIPVVHGYDHAYPTYAPILEEKGDPYNQHTVSTFNEFKGQPYDTILTKLKEARQFLQEQLGQPVDGYIPPCNRADRKTGQALQEAGYRYYLSEKRIRGCQLLWHKSDFYGRSNDYEATKNPDILTLHVTWEWDLLRKGITGTLEPLLNHLATRKKVERERGVQLGIIVAGAQEA